MATTGGSSGVPVRVRKTAVDDLLWEAMTIRHMLWHCDSLDGTMISLRPPKSKNGWTERDGGFFAPDWGRPAGLIWKTGRMGAINGSLPIQTVANFIVKATPKYITCLPSALRLLVSHFRDNNISLLSLGSVWAQSEIVDEALRDACREVLGCEIIETYSAAEVGYLALQCPATAGLHITAETQLVEILDTDNAGCRAGEIGGVVVTPLHNFAMPLLRYEIGDEAEVGAACACGRGLPTLRRIIGRSGDYALLKNGVRRRLSINNYALSKIEAIREFQVAQKAFDELELRLVVSRALTEIEAQRAKGFISERMGREFKLTVTYHETLPRTPAGKLRAFVSEIQTET